MRKIISKQEQERIRRRNQWLVGIFIIGLLVIGTLGYALQGSFYGANDVSSGTKISYNGFEFESWSGFWILGDFLFRYTPNEVPEIDFEAKKLDEYKNKPLYIYSESAEAKYEITINLGKIAGKIEDACLDGYECSGDFPVKTCEDNFIIIEDVSDTDGMSEITAEGNCVFIKGSQENLIKLADQFLFKVLGVK